MVQIKQICSLLIANVVLSGCMTPGAFHHRVDEIKPGMGKEEALGIMKGRPSLTNFNWVPGVEIYEFRICEHVDDCRTERLVFVNDRYAGPGLETEEVLRTKRIKAGLSKLEWATLGVIPDEIQKPANNEPEREYWIYRYVDRQHRKMALILFFKNGEVENWVNVREYEVAGTAPGIEESGAARFLFELFLNANGVLWP